MLGGHTSCSKSALGFARCKCQGIAVTAVTQIQYIQHPDASAFEVGEIHLLCNLTSKHVCVNSCFADCIATTALQIGQ